MTNSTDPQTPAANPYCQEVAIPPNGLQGLLTVPANCQGLVLFAHGSGSSRLSPRNTMVADRLNARGFATLLFDLLRMEESHDVENVFDVSLLAERLVEATYWARQQQNLKSLSIGYFGASTGAAAALKASIAPSNPIAAVVSRGGRPDLVDAQTLKKVKSPTRLIVGAADHDVLALNEQVLLLLTCEAKLDIIPNATHLFEEPGTLEKAADLAADWFARFMHSHNTATNAS